MARKMGINSVIGSYLDPLADKVIQASPPSNFSDKCGMLSGSFKPPR